MKVLIACEYSGIVRDCFSKNGHNSISCDLLPTESKGKHYQGNIFDIINNGFDLMIAHPPCTFLCTTGNRWFLPKYINKYPTRKQDRKDAIEFFIKLINANIDKIAIENPIGIMSTLYRKPDQIIQPYEYGDPVSKKTCLWLKNLPKLIPTKIVEPEFIILPNGKRMSKFHNNLRNHKDRQKLRSKTFLGIAQAMADQWG
jgi:hypothetical protein